VLRSLLGQREQAVRKHSESERSLTNFRLLDLLRDGFLRQAKENIILSTWIFDKELEADSS